MRTKGYCIFSKIVGTKWKRKKKNIYIYIAERLSARLLIVQCSQFAFVYIYIYMYVHIYICIYISITL